MSKRFHNILFTLFIGAILGATIYLLYTNMPTIGTFRHNFDIPRRAESREISKNRTEEMIKNKELSDHKAKHYRYE